MTWTQALEVWALGFAAGVFVYVAAPAIRYAMRPRNHRVSQPLGRPDPSCVRNYVP